MLQPYAKYVSKNIVYHRTGSSRINAALEATASSSTNSPFALVESSNPTKKPHIYRVLRLILLTS